MPGTAKIVIVIALLAIPIGLVGHFRPALLSHVFSHTDDAGIPATKEPVAESSPEKNTASIAGNTASPVKSNRYFLLERISLRTDSGVTSIPVGTKVKLLEKTHGGMKVMTGDGEKLDVTDSQVTNDPAQVAALLQQIAASEGNAKAQQDAAAAAAAAKAADNAAKLNATLNAIYAAKPSASGSNSRMPDDSTLDAPPDPTGKVVHRRKKK